MRRLSLCCSTRTPASTFRTSAVERLWIARRLVKLPSITLVNLLAGEELFPEIATSRDESDRVAPHVVGWLTDAARRAAAVGRLEALRDRVAVPGACDRAAEFLIAEVAGRRARRAA